MNSLLARFAMLLAAVLLALIGALTAAMREGLDPASLALGPEAAAAIAALAVFVVAIAVLAVCTRRLRRLSREIEALGKGGFANLVSLADADVHGDEVARLAAQMEHMAERVASQDAALQRVARERHDLLANVAHDLRTPLASMQGYLELLLLGHEPLEPAEAHNYLQTAARQSERLGRLVADLFELTQLESGETRASAEDFALAEIAHDVAQRFASDAGQRGVHLIACADAALSAPAAAIVHADIGLVERALAALVDNALRQTPSGGEVKIEYGCADGRALLAVSDSGKGLTAAELAGLFDRYERHERVGAANDESNGSGLGLALARCIVGLHGGKLRAKSPAGRGTRIFFDLPLAASAACADVSASDPHRAGEAALVQPKAAHERRA